MSAGTLYDTGAPTIEVRIYSHDRLLTRELCESEDDVAAVIDGWSDVANLFVLVDDLPVENGPGDVIAHEAPDVDMAEDYTIASAPIPGYGTE
jgi:hypothetical protein